MTCHKLCACVTAFCCLVATIYTSGNLWTASVTATDVEDVRNHYETLGKTASTKIDLEPEDMLLHSYFPALAEGSSPNFDVKAEECTYPTDGDGVGRLDLNVGRDLAVAFRCPGVETSYLTPEYETQAFPVGSDGRCNTTTPVNLSDLIPHSTLKPRTEYDGRVHDAVFAVFGLSLESEKKACFVCKSEDEHKVVKECIVTVTVPKATLPSSWVCDPFHPPTENMLIFAGDGPQRKAVVHCPDGYSRLDPRNNNDYFATGPQCTTTAKLEEILGPGSAIREAQGDSRKGVSKSYEIIAASQFEKPRIICLACVGGGDGEAPPPGFVCLMTVFLPARGAEEPGKGKVGEGSPRETDTPPNTTPPNATPPNTMPPNTTPTNVTPPSTTSEGAVLSCATAAVFLSVTVALKTVVM